MAKKGIGVPDPPWYEPGNTTGIPQNTPSVPTPPKKKAKKKGPQPSDVIFGIESYVGDSTGYTPWQNVPGPQFPTPDTPTTPTTTDTGSTDGGGQKPTDTAPPINWAAWLEDWGFDPDIIKELDRMSRLYSADKADIFVRDAIAYIRSTPWHAKMFVGFADAVRSGMIGDERQYRQYVNAVNDSYLRYFNRGITSDELVQSFRNSWDTRRVEGELAAGAYVKTNRNDLQYLFGAFDEQGQRSEEDLQSIGRQQVGIGNQLGGDLLRRVSQAQERLRRVFEGTLGSPSFSVGSGRLQSPSLGAANLPPDIGR